MPALRRGRHGLIREPALRAELHRVVARLLADRLLRTTATLQDRLHGP